MATSWLLRIALLLTTYDLAVDKFDFAPVQSPEMRSSRCKKILVQGDEPKKFSVKFLFWCGRGNYGVKNEKMKTKNSFAAYTFLETCQTILQTSWPIEGTIWRYDLSKY